MSRSQWRLGVAGLGTVGGSLLSLLKQRPHFAPTGAGFTVTGVSARSRTAERETAAAGAQWFDDPVALAASPETDVFVELMGGAEGAARRAVETALDLGKPVVTANKALIATHGKALAVLAEARGVPLLYEAAVMGGTPAVKVIREALVGDEIESVAGILNGTCNFILSQMEASSRGFADVLAEAQSLGYAEADPTTDVGGFDAAHKISILAALAFRRAPNLDAAEIEGIEAIDLLDIRLARDLGYRIKLIASAVTAGEGVAVRVHPALVPLDHPIARVDGALNALAIHTRDVGPIFIQGAGAGGAATAAAVAADLADLTARPQRPVFQKRGAELEPLGVGKDAQPQGRVYVRVLVRDVPGVIASISETLAAAGVSIDSFLQKPVDGGGGVPIVLTTHEAPETVIAQAVSSMAALPAMLAAPRVIRVARL